MPFYSLSWLPIFFRLLLYLLSPLPLPMLLMLPIVVFASFGGCFIVRILLQYVPVVYPSILCRFLYNDQFAIKFIAKNCDALGFGFFVRFFFSFVICVRKCCMPPKALSTVQRTSFCFDILWANQMKIRWIAIECKEKIVKEKQRKAYRSKVNHKANGNNIVKQLTHSIVLCIAWKWRKTQCHC